MALGAALDVHQGHDDKAQGAERFIDAGGLSQPLPCSARALLPLAACSQKVQQTLRKSCARAASSTALHSGHAAEKGDRVGCWSTADALSRACLVTHVTSEICMKKHDNYICEYFL